MRERKWSKEGEEREEKGRRRKVRGKGSKEQKRNIQINRNIEINHPEPSTKEIITAAGEVAVSKSVHYRSKTESTCPTYPIAKIASSSTPGVASSLFSRLTRLLLLVRTLSITLIRRWSFLITCPIRRCLPLSTSSRCVAG